MMMTREYMWWWWWRWGVARARGITREGYAIHYRPRTFFFQPRLSISVSVRSGYISDIYIPLTHERPPIHSSSIPHFPSPFFRGRRERRSGIQNRHVHSLPLPFPSLPDKKSEETEHFLLKEEFSQSKKTWARQFPLSRPSSSNGCMYYWYVLAKSTKYIKQ